MRRLGAGERVIGVGFVTIEEMFAVNEHFLAGKGCGLDGLADGVQVFFIGAAQRHTHMVVPGLRHKTDGRGFRADQVLQAGIIGNGTPCPLHHAEGGELGFGLSVLAEERRIGRVCAGIATLDVVDTKTIQHLHHDQLVIQRKINAGRLLSVTQRGVKKGDMFSGHDLLLLPSPLEGEGVARAARDG